MKGALFPSLITAVLLAGCAPPRLTLPGIAPPASAPTPMASAPAQAPLATPSRTPIPDRPAAPPGRATPGLTGPKGLSGGQQAAVFQQAHALVATRYVYTDFNGADWNGIYTPTLARIRTGLDDETFYELMYSLMDSLADGHSYYLSPDDAADQAEARSGTGERLSFGFSYDVAQDMSFAYVLQVVGNGPADRAGIRPHDRVLRLNGQPAIDESLGDLTDAFFDPKILTASLTVQTPGGKPRDVVLTKARVSSRVQIDARILPGKKRIGYLSVPSFDEDGIAATTRQKLADLMKGGNLDGLIVDLRLNPGGDLDEMAKVFGFLSTGPLGRLVGRNGQSETLNPPGERIGNAQKAPLAVLIGWQTASAGEILAGALQAQKRARLIGQRTEGNIEMITDHTLSDGSVLWLAERRFVLPNGATWEGTGLGPDVAVDADWETYTENNDPYIKAALDLLSR